MDAEQQNQKNIESLMRLIRRAVKAGKFAPCFAICSSLTDQNRYIEELRKRCAELEISLVDVALWNRGLIHNLREVVLETINQRFPDGDIPANLAIHVTGLEISILLDPDEQFPTVLQTMNMGREAFVKDFPYPFLIWLPEYAYTKLANIAPDFWSIRYGSYTFLSDTNTEHFYDVDQIPSDARNRTLWRDKMDQIPLIKRILESARETTPQTDTDLYIKLGDAYRFIGKTEKARKSYEEALRLSRELGDREREGSAFNGLGLIYTESGEYSKAVDCFERYLKLRKQQGKDEALAVGYNHLGLVYDKQRNYEQAIHCYQKALEFAQESRTKGDVLGNLGLVYRKLGKFDEALAHHQQALHISQDLDDFQSILRDLGNIGLVHHDLEDYERAIQYYTQALQLSHQKEYKRDELDQHLNLGDAYRDWGKCEEAKASYGKARELAKVIGDRKLELTALGKLSDLYCPKRFNDVEQEIFWTEKFFEQSKLCPEERDNLSVCIAKVIEICCRQDLNRHTKRDWLFKAEAIMQRLLKQSETSENSITYHEKLIDIYKELDLSDEVEKYQQRLDELKKFRGINIWLEPGTVEVENSQPILHVQQFYTFNIQIGSPVDKYAWIYHRDFQYLKKYEKSIDAKREGFKVSSETIENGSSITIEYPVSPSSGKLSIKEQEQPNSVVVPPNELSDIGKTDGTASTQTFTEVDSISKFAQTTTVFFEFRGDSISFDASKKELLLRGSDILHLMVIPEKIGEHRIIVSVTLEEDEFQDHFEIPLRVESFIVSDLTILITKAQQANFVQLGKALSELKAIDFEKAKQVLDYMDLNVLIAKAERANFAQLGKALSELKVIDFEKAKQVLDYLDSNVIVLKAEQASFEQLGKVLNELKAIDAEKAKQVFDYSDVTALVAKAEKISFGHLARALNNLKNINIEKAKQVFDYINFTDLVSKAEQTSFAQLGKALTELITFDLEKTKQVFYYIDSTILVTKAEQASFAQLGIALNELKTVDFEKAKQVLDYSDITVLVAKAEQASFAQLGKVLNDLKTINPEQVKQILNYIDLNILVIKAEQVSFALLGKVLNELKNIDPEKPKQVFDCFDIRVLTEKATQLSFERLVQALYKLKSIDVEKTKQILEHIDPRVLEEKATQISPDRLKEALIKLRVINPTMTFIL